MEHILPFIIAGLAAGSVYGLAGVGLVLTYKTSGIFNFAHGAVATIAAYAFYFLHVDHGIPWPIALVLSVLVLGPIVGIVLELVARRLARVNTMWQIVATVGLILAVIGFFGAEFGHQAKIFPPFLPTGEAFAVEGVIVSWEQVIITVTALLITGALFLFFRFSLLGLAMRGVVDNAELLALGGMKPVAVRRWSWIFGATFAALAGTALAPSLNLDATLLTLLVVQAFGAAAIGFFSNLPATYLGGLVIGVAAALCTKVVAAYPSQNWLAGIPSSIPFIVLLLVLIATPRHRLADRRILRHLNRKRYRAPLRVQLVGAVVVLAFLALVPMLVGGGKLAVYTDGLTKVVLFLSLGLLVRSSGQVSLCQIAFAAIGAASFSHFATDLHLPWLLAVAFAGLVVVPIGALVAIPAIRLSGVFLALATFAFGLAVEQVAYPLGVMFGRNGVGSPTPRPAVLGFDSDKGYYYLVLIFVVFFAVVVTTLTRGRLGRLLSGLAASPTALSTNGVNINTVKVLVFGISAFIAGVYGALYGGVVTTVSSGEFPSFSALTVVALLVLVWGGEPWYALMAALGLTVIPSYFSGQSVADWLNVIFGLSSALIAIQGGHYMPEWVKRSFDVLARGLEPRKRRAGATDLPGKELTFVPERVAADGRIAITNVRVQFGGNLVLNDVSLEASMGQITGLIGPNGAGKTTMFNVCSGLLRQGSGEVYLNNDPLRRRATASRAQAGLGRTFQRLELFETLSVRENVAISREASMAAATWRKLIARPGERNKVDAAVDAALELCGLKDVASFAASELSTGQRRLVELARCLAGPYAMLLLDEPSSGLDAAETAAFGRLLKKVVHERGLGILLVEHDMSLVMSVCDYIYVLDFGVQIFEGTPEEVAASEAVRLAYLGASVISAEHPAGQPSEAVT